MTTIAVDIPDDVNQNIGLSKHMSIWELFNSFWIDLDFVLQERIYSKKFLNDVKNNNFLVDNKF